MATLSMHLELSDLKLALGATAVVEQLTDAAGALPREPFQRSIAIRAGDDGVTSLAVPAGLYQVSATLPSGEVLRQQRKIEEGIDTPIVLRAEPSPSERLAFQRLGGTVGDQRSHEIRLLQSQLKERGFYRGVIDGLVGPQTSTAIHNFQLARNMPPTGKISADVLAALDEAPEPPAGRRRIGRGGARATPGDPVPAERVTFGIPSDPGGEDAWKRWRAFAHADTSAKLFPNSLYDRTASFEERYRDSLTVVWRAHVPDHELLRRRWGVIRAPNEATIVSLPLPWITYAGAVAVDADVTVDLRPTVGKSNVNVTVQDADLGALLLYLASGRLSAAVPMLEAIGDGETFIERILKSKRQNPLAACAAAYVGVATWSEDQPPPWQPWLKNLADWFPLIPDGAVIVATWGLQDLGRSNPLDVLTALKIAFTRGVPFYTAGLRGLLDGLSLFAAEDGEARRMHELVQLVARRADPMQAFTTLRLPARRRT